MSTIDFLRDIGKHFRVNTMVKKDAVSARMNSDVGISYTEFSYQILQGMDFLELYRRYGCTLQSGGSDQWGNLTAGTDLIHRVEGKSVHLLATPLITDAAGNKIGKSTGGGGIWLNPAMTSPYAFYQYFLNVEDALVGTLLRTLTFVERDEILDLEKETAERPAARSGQRRLAAEVTTLVHGARETEEVIAASQALFGRGTLDELDPGTLGAALVEAGLTTISAGPELPTYASLLKESGLVSSMNEARRAIADGGAYVNNTRVTDPEGVPAAADLLHGRWLVLRRGKKTIAGVEIAR
jgi:tyrosyl-tRNA synthetase